MRCITKVVIVGWIYKNLWHFILFFWFSSQFVVRLCRVNTMLYARRNRRKLRRMKSRIFFLLVQFNVKKWNERRSWLFYRPRMTTARKYMYISKTKRICGHKSKWFVQSCHIIAWLWLIKPNPHSQYNDLEYVRTKQISDINSF